jgi:hypothetical protein
MTPTPYPTDCYIVHRWFGQKYGGWADLGDGPVETRDEAEIAIMEAFKDEWRAADLTTVKVWHVQPDVPPRDVTEDLLRSIGAWLSEKWRDELHRFGEASDFPQSFRDWAADYVEAA